MPVISAVLTLSSPAPAWDAGPPRELARAVPAACLHLGLRDGARLAAAIESDDPSAGHALLEVLIARADVVQVEVVGLDLRDWEPGEPVPRPAAARAGGAR